MTRGFKRCTKVYTRNRYYLRNSERLKARSRSVYMADPSKKKAAVAALYNLQPKKKIGWSIRPIIVPIRPRGKPIVLPITVSLNVLPLELFMDPDKGNAS